MLKEDIDNENSDSQRESPEKRHRGQTPQSGGRADHQQT